MIDFEAPSHLSQLSEVNFSRIQGFSLAQSQAHLEKETNVFDNTDADAPGNIILINSQDSDDDGAPRRRIHKQQPLVKGEGNGNGNFDEDDEFSEFNLGYDLKM